jgi:hypothetical protein
MHLYQLKNNYLFQGADERSSIFDMLLSPAIESQRLAVELIEREIERICSKATIHHKSQKRNTKAYQKQLSVELKLHFISKFIVHLIESAPYDNSKGTDLGSSMKAITGYHKLGGWNVSYEYEDSKGQNDWKRKSNLGKVKRFQGVLHISSRNEFTKEETGGHNSEHFNLKLKPIIAKNITLRTELAELTVSKNLSHECKITWHYAIAYLFDVMILGKVPDLLNL